MTAEEAEAEMSGDLGPRTRRLSVRRMRQADKNNMMRDSIKEEAMMRRESMVQQVRNIQIPQFFEAFPLHNVPVV